MRFLHFRGTPAERCAQAQKLQRLDGHVVLRKDVQGIPTGVDLQASAEANRAGIDDAWYRATHLDAMDEAKGMPNRFIPPVEMAKIADTLDVPLLVPRAALRSALTVLYSALDRFQR